jgi:hypothetical protein
MNVASFPKQSVKYLAMSLYLIPLGLKVETVAVLMLQLCAKCSSSCDIIFEPCNLCPQLEKTGPYELEISHH